MLAAREGAAVLGDPEIEDCRFRFGKVHQLASAKNVEQLLIVRVGIAQGEDVANAATEEKRALVEEGDMGSDLVTVEFNVGGCSDGDGARCRVEEPEEDLAQG